MLNFSFFVKLISRASLLLRLIAILFFFYKHISFRPVFASLAAAQQVIRPLAYAGLVAIIPAPPYAAAGVACENECATVTQSFFFFLQYIGLGLRA